MSQPFDEDPSFREDETAKPPPTAGTTTAAKTTGAAGGNPRPGVPAAPPRPAGESSASSIVRMPHGVNAIGPIHSNMSNSSVSQMGHNMVTMESPLPPVVQRGLGDRSTEKRKNAALEIEALVKSLLEANNVSVISNIIVVLSKDFCTSMNSNYRKGGLVGLAAASIGLMGHSRDYLSLLLPPVLHCFDDPESRVRYYAAESLYNIAKVSRQSILAYFTEIFEGLTKLFADVDVDVKNGATLLDRLMKDIVTEANTFSIDQFLPLLQTYIRRTNPYIRQLIVGWITLLDSVPDISMLDYLPDFLDGLFQMLGDANREIRQAADSALSEFLRELGSSCVMEFGPIIAILVQQCRSRERLNRLTAITWISELIHHPHSGGDKILPFHSTILSAIMSCISDEEKEIRLVADRTNDDLLVLLNETKQAFELKSLLDALVDELLEKEDVPTKMAALRWINMLMEKRKTAISMYTEELLPVLLRTLSDPADAVVILDLQVLSRVSLLQPLDKKRLKDTEEAQFQLVLTAIINLFAEDRQLLETRGSLIIRKLCVLLNAKSVYIRMADTLASFEGDETDPADHGTLQFISTMVQTLNLILLTASELHDLRATLTQSFANVPPKEDSPDHEEDANHVFATLFHCWTHDPVATFSLCLLARAYDLSFDLVKRFAEMEDVSVGFLMQVDKLVHLLESPIFLHLRLQLLDVGAPYHAPLLKSIYGLLMCLPQGKAFHMLNERLTAVCNLRDNLGITSGNPDDFEPIVSNSGLSMEKLLERYDGIQESHKLAAESAHSVIVHLNPNGKAPTKNTDTKRPTNKVTSSTNGNFSEASAQRSSVTKITVHQRN